jgi:drug/metabolite transporter (DMT)-like permease
MTAIRRARAVSMIPALALGMLVVSGVAVAMGAGPPVPGDVSLVVLQGAILIPGAIALLGTAPRYISSPEVMLIMRLEMVLGPLWVWLIVGEPPTAAALVAGAVILATLTIHTLMGLREPDPDGGRRGASAVTTT